MIRTAPTSMSKTAGPVRKGPPPRIEVGNRIKVTKTGAEGTVRFVGPVAVLPSGERRTQLRTTLRSFQPAPPPAPYPYHSMP